jgi:8-oxo-dGTP diphosphatase
MSKTATPKPPLIAAGLLVKQRKVLLCHRLPSRESFPDVWDFPGGHVEANEAPAAALVRELHEEIGVWVRVPERPSWARLATDDFDLRVWLITEWVGTPRNIAVGEHDEIGWFSQPKAVDLNLAHAVYPSLITTALRLP